MSIARESLEKSYTRKVLKTASVTKNIEDDKKNEVSNGKIQIQQVQRLCESKQNRAERKIELFFD